MQPALVWLCPTALSLASCCISLSAVAGTGIEGVKSANSTRLAVSNCPISGKLLYLSERCFRCMHEGVSRMQPALVWLCPTAVSLASCCISLSAVAGTGIEGCHGPYRTHLTSTPSSRSSSRGLGC